MKDGQLVDFLLDRLGDYKIEDLDVIDVSEKSSLTKYLVIGTGRSRKHIESTMERVRFALKREGAALKTLEGRSSGWVILDLGDIILNLFTEEDREKYNLSKLWREEMDDNMAKLLGPARDTFTENRN
jgi:ribosome-associated protein